MFQDTRNARLKNKIIDYNDNTIVNFPFGLAPILADHYVTDIKIADDANISWSKISKLGSKLSDLEEVNFTNLKQGQIPQFDGFQWVNADLASVNPWDPAAPETITNKTMAFGSNTFTGFPYITASSTNTLTNKSIDFNSNTITNYPSGAALPDGTTTSKAKVGRFWGGAADGDMMFSGLTINGAFTTELTTTDVYSTFTSASTDASLGGFSTTGKVTRRAFNPVFKVKSKTNISTERPWWGMADIDMSSIVNSDTPLNNHTGVLIMYSDVVNNYTVLWNNGGATEQSFTHSAKDAVVHTITITLNDSAGSLTVNFDGSNIVNGSTTQVPASTTDMYVHVNHEAIGTTASPMAIAYAYIAQDH